MAIKRYSKQRELIYDAVMNTTEHPTAETIYIWLKPDNPALSLGTVYRNLNQLVEEGNVMRLTFPVERFDAKTKPHAHFMCNDCGCVCDLMDISYDYALDEKVQLTCGHIVNQHELIFDGTCVHCTEKK